MLAGEPRLLIETGTRRPKRVADVEANAPQLMRVVKTPYGLHPTWARRKKFRQAREKLQRWHRERTVEQAFEATRRRAFSSPAGTRERGEYPDIPRGLAARYHNQVTSSGGAE